MTDINIGELLKIRQMKENFIPSRDNIVFKIEGKNIGSLQNYVTFAGIPKSGKSTILAALISTIFLKGDLWDMKLELPKDRQKVAYFDTESADVEFYAQVDKIRKFADVQNISDKILMYQVREDQPSTIRKMIEYCLQVNTDVSVVFIDGLLDLCINYNDEKETRLLTNWLKRITKQYNVLVITVIHLGKKDGETLGHLGSNSDRWAQSTLTITKNKEEKTFTLESKFLRSAEDITPIVIHNLGGYWQKIHDLGIHAMTKEDELINDILYEEKSYKNLVAEIMRRNKKGMNYAKGLIKKWIQEEKIEKTETGYILKNPF